MVSSHDELLLGIICVPRCYSTLSIRVTLVDILADISAILLWELVLCLICLMLSRGFVPQGIDGFRLTTNMSYKTSQRSDEALKQYNARLPSFRVI